MYKKKKIVAIITARAGSKGVKNKNTKKLNGFPLISYSILSAKKSKLIDKVFVSTDGKKISRISKTYGAEVINRPKKLSNDVIHSDAAVVHAINYISKYLNFDFEYLVFIQPTSPLRNKTELDLAIKKCIEKKLDTVFSSTDYKPFIWIKKRGKILPDNFNPKKRKRRQVNFNINETGSFYVVKKNSFLKNKDRFGKKVSNFDSDFYSAFEIDNIEEFKFIEKLLRHSVLKDYNLCLPKKNEVNQGN